MCGQGLDLTVRMRPCGTREQEICCGFKGRHLAAGGSLPSSYLTIPPLCIWIGWAFWYVQHKPELFFLCVCVFEDIVEGQNIYQHVRASTVRETVRTRVIFFFQRYPIFRHEGEPMWITDRRFAVKHSHWVVVWMECSLKHTICPSLLSRRSHPSASSALEQ